jgi:homoserine O-acetyltransferase
VAVEAGLADLLGIERWASVIGGSMGGMRALEWAVTYPERVGSVAVFAVGAYHSAEQVALCSGQVHAVKADPKWRGGDYYEAADGDGPHVGLGVARRLAHVSYRSEPELAIRFGRDPQAHEDPLRCGRFAVESYLDHHADKLARRFDANTYIVLTEAMNSHDVGRGRGGITAALRRYPGPAIVGGVDSDRLYPVYQQQQIADGLAGTVGGLRVISSAYGHDAFLIATDQIAPMLREFLAAHAASAA